MIDVSEGMSDQSFVTVSLCFATILLIGWFNMGLEGLEREQDYCEGRHTLWGPGYGYSDEWYDGCINEAKASYESGNLIMSTCCLLFWILPTLLIVWVANGWPMTQRDLPGNLK